MNGLQSPNGSLVSLVGNRPATTSLAIAKHFGKNHQHVMRDIRTLIADCPKEFGQSSYTNEQGKDQPLYHVYFDGFILLVMGYTGDKALEMKLAYIAAFNAMREQLAQRQQGGIPKIQTLADLYALRFAQYEHLPKAEKQAVSRRIAKRLRSNFGFTCLARLPKERWQDAAILITAPMRRSSYGGLLKEHHGSISPSDRKEKKILDADRTGSIPSDLSLGLFRLAGKLRKASEQLQEVAAFAEGLSKSFSQLTYPLPTRCFFGPEFSGPFFPDPYAISLTSFASSSFGKIPCMACS